MRDLTDARCHRWGTGRSGPCESPMKRTSPPRPSGPAAGRSLRSSGQGNEHVGPCTQTRLWPAQRTDRRPAAGACIPSRTYFCLQDCVVSQMTTGRSQYSAGKRSPRTESTSSTRTAVTNASAEQPEPLSPHRTLLRRLRPETLAGRLMHEGGVVLARGCPYCTRPRPPWSTPTCRPVASIPRAVAFSLRWEGSVALPCLQVAGSATTSATTFGIDAGGPGKAGEQRHRAGWSSQVPLDAAAGLG